MQRTAAVFFLLSLARAASSQIVINEIGIAPTGGNGSQFVELFNRSGCTVDVSCYTVVFSSTSGGGNPTGWTIKIPSGKNIAAGGYFILGGTAGTAGVVGSGYPTGGIVNSYVGIADVNIGSTAITANAVYMRQGLAAGNFSNTKGQLSLLDASGNLVTAVSYNSGNNAGTYPLSAYTTCNASGNAQGTNNVPNPGNAVLNVPGVFSAATNQGIYLNSSGNYSLETSLTPGTSNTGNGGTQVCSGPVLNSVSNAAVCFNAVNQNATLTYTATNSPINYSIAWSGLASNYFTAVNNAVLLGNVAVNVPASVPPGVYTGMLTLHNACGSSCSKAFTITVNALPAVSAGNYAPVCINSSAIVLSGTPVGGIFSGANVVGNNFVPPGTAGNYTVSYVYTDAITGCTNTASSAVTVSAPANTYTTACTNNAAYVFLGQTLTGTGLYTVYVNSGNGCTDTARIYLVIKQTQFVDSTACDSLAYNGITYYNDTTLVQTVSSAVLACDSIERQIRLRIKHSTAKDTTICLTPNQSLSLLGQTFTSSGHYVLHTTNTEGCDSIVRLHLTVASTETQTHTGCDSVRINGQSFFTSTTFTDTLRNQQGCDSVIRTHSVAVYHSSHSYLNICLAPGQGYNFNGQTLTKSGDYTAAFNGVHCDSIVHLHLLIAELQTTRYQGCNGFTYNGITYTSSTTLVDTLRTMLSCDSLIRTVQIIIAPVLHTYINACIRQGQIYSFNNQSLTTGGHYTAQLVTHDGCDSFVHLYLTVATSQMQDLNGCDSLQWKGKSYYASTQLIDTVRSLLSLCDSLYQLTNINIVTSPVRHISVCLGTGQTYAFNGQTLHSSGLYSGVFSRPGLCDSTVHLKLVVAVVQQQTISGCGSVVYKSVTYLSSVTLRDTVRSIYLCDSVYQIIQLTVLPAEQTFATACIKQGQLYNFNGQALTTGGYYSSTFHTNACDSIVRLYLTVTQTKTQALQGCDSVLFNGQVYYSSAAAQDTIRSLVSGCDSVITITTLAVLKTKHSYLSVCLTEGQTYNFNGQALNSTGNYQAVYRTGNCDSFVHLHLLVASSQSIVLRGCNKVVYNGITYASSTIVRDTVKSVVTSCDSLYREANIVISPVLQNFITACVAPGSAYFFNGQSLALTGNYTASFTTAAGCDSVVNLYLVATKLNQQSISGCDSVIYNGITYTASTVIMDTVKSIVSQCDSVINTTVITANKKLVIDVSSDTAICRWGTATLTASTATGKVSWTGFGNSNSIAVSPANTTQYFATAVDTNGCRNTKAVTVSVQDFAVVLKADINPAFSGTNVFVQSSGNYFYSVSSWLPANLFSNQLSKSQRFAIDTSVSVSVIGESSLGCKDTASLQLIAVPLDDVYVPSAFTPNSDGRNDEVKVMSTAISEIDFKIFNRWGQMVFHSTDKSRGWNGITNGFLHPAGTYVYVVRVKKVSGQVVEKKGTITLIR